MENSSALILAGGKSERMKSPKPFLLTEGETFLEKLVEGYIKVVSEIVIVLIAELADRKWNNYLSKINKKCNIVLNRYNEKGKFYSLQLGVKNISGDFCFVQNVDNPYVNPFLLEQIYRNKNPNGITIPAYKGKNGHPILISKNVLEKIPLIENTDTHLKDFYSSFSKKQVEVGDDSILININTPEDYSTAFSKFQTLENLIK